MRKLICVLGSVLFLTPSQLLAQQSGSGALPHTIVYKTRKNYKKLVPVVLSADKKSIVSYPGPSDVKTGSGYPLPVSLHGGYLLDKYGVGANTAFLKLTYQQYAKLKAAPDPAQLYKMIVDKNPVTELCDCGAGKKYSVKQLNELIDKKRLKTECRSLK